MAKANKRYYWLRLQHDFFDSKRIKKLRRMAGGDTYTIIYLKMQLLSLENDGYLRWTGLEDTFADELALDLDESPDDVQVTLQYMLRCGLAETDDDNASIFLPYVACNTGSECASTIRSRECRERQKMLQCNTNATLLQQSCNVEKEIEKEKEIDIEIDKKEKDKKKKDVLEEFCIHDEVKEAVRSFMRMRKNIKKPMTDQAVKRLINKLRDMTLDPTEQIAILQQSEDKCWLDIYPLKRETTSSGHRDWIQNRVSEVDSWV